jgi:hypothetical protein
MLIIFLICLSCNWSYVYAQGTAPTSRPQSGTHQDTVENSSTEIGQSGYVVKVPEIRMRNIIGDRSQKKTVEEEPQAAPLTPLRDLPDDHVSPTEPERDQVNRLPFDPVTSEERESAPVAETDPQTATTPESQSDQPVAETRPEEPQAEETPSQLKETTEENPVYHPPIAPEETFDPTFVPKREILRRSSPPKIPATAELDLRSQKISRMELSSRLADDMIAPEEWLSLAPRPGPAIVELLEQEREQVSERPRDAEEIPGHGSSETTVPSSSRPEKPGLSETAEGSSRGPDAETEPGKISQSEEPPAKETIDPRPTKEMMATPLDDDALDSREARDYLRETAPILEELSLLMTRAPGLTIADYDPSDANSSLIPADIKLKMTSIKRELQVLDSKTFAVIPPPKYLEFHGLVRQSIAQAYMACDAIINYFEENKAENFQKAKEHLVKAGDFIRQATRP